MDGLMLSTARRVMWCGVWQRVRGVGVKRGGGKRAGWKGGSSQSVTAL
jgi:hypothetical protein